jgi:CHAD domain-containing protein
MREQGDRSRLTPALLAMPAPRAVRVIARGLLGDVLAAQARFEKDEADALHDLRVALRRLRSWLRAFRPELSDTVKGRTRRRLRALASATGEARDAEVMLAFIERQRRLPSRTRAGIRVVVGQLEHERDHHVRGLRRTLARDVSKATRDLARQLESYWVRHRIDEPSTVRSMAAVFGDAVRHQAKQVESALARIEPPGKAEHVHRARIAAKRLRYLLEPSSEALGAEEPIGQLQALQRQLGDARDAHRIAMRLVRDIGEGAARHARGRALATAGIAPADGADASSLTASVSGLRELARRAQAAREAAFAEFVARWGDGEAAVLVHRIDDLVARVSASQSPHHALDPSPDDSPVC